MRLDHLLTATEVLASEADPALEVTGVAYDSRAVTPGDLFVAIPGLKVDGHDFLSNAATWGAVAAVVERPIPDPPLPLVRVPSSRKALADLACRLHDDPTRVLTLLGVTGTNGKTTTCYLLESILAAAGHVTGLVGTVETRLRGVPLDAPEAVAARTTPEAPDLQALFARMVRDGATAAVMEVSSHALALERVRGCAFDVAVFTNLTPDHLDFHATMERYFAAKRRLFTEYAPGAAAINVDDAWGRRLAADVPGAVTFGVGDGAEGPPPKVRPTDLTVDADGIRFAVLHEHGEVDVVSPLAGTHNVYNLLSAVAAALALGLPAEAIGQGLAAAPPVPGRLERVEAGQDFTVLVDYAHTPDALERVLAAVRPLVRTGAPAPPPMSGVHGAAPQAARPETAPGRLITVVGCGGDRDATKRGPMGAVAAKGSDRVFFTADNPRSESPDTICAVMAEGAKNAGGAPCTVIVDREEAIARALSEARAGDVVLLAGKGHERVQVLADRTIPFDDRDVARRLLAGKA
jgi:UDP-N-acetylmuramoyl-L-alanyl-D-glutamate--2,6-diaminopimelate ligase